MNDRRENNPDRIIAFLRLLFRPEDVFEVRALDAERPGYRRPHVESGYFDFEHIDAVPAALAEITAARGVYVTLNPVNPALLARAANRIRPVGQEPTTADADVVARCWLPIDCDPVRPAGISATDAEHELAIAKANEVRDGMATLGWSDPVVIDSGNGGQLLYPIDLPAEDGGLVQRCLQALASAGDDRVEIDQAVHNPARIWRLPGTWNCKGDSIPDRPHRLAEVLSAPDAPQVVSVALLEALANTIAPIAETRRSAPCAPVSGPGGRPGDEFNQRGEIGPILESHGWQRIGESGGNQLWRRPGKTTGNHSATFDGRTFYVFSSAAPPFEANQGHSPFAVYAMLEHGGDYAAASASLAESGYGDAKIPTDDSDVDLTALLTRFSPEPSEAPDTSMLPEDPGILPAELLEVPGLIGEIMAWSLRTAPHPNTVLSFTGALAMMSWLTGRNVRTPGGLRTNLYLVAIAESGAGKDWPRKANACLLKDLGQTAAYATRLASSEAVEDALEMTPCLLDQPDEVDTLIRAISNDTGGGGGNGRYMHLSATLMELYTSADMIYACRRLANQHRARRNNEEARTIDQPHLVIFSAATPEAFFSALSEQLISRGFLSRCLILDTPDRSPRQPAVALDETPASILEQARAWVDFQGGGDGNLLAEHPRPAEISMTHEAQEIMSACWDACDARYDAGDGAAKPIWSRCAAMAEQLALLHACSTGTPPEPISIGEDAAAWGVAVATHLAERLLWHVARHVGDGEFAKAQLKLLRALEEQGGEASRRDIKRALRALRPREFDEVVKSLIDQERIEFANIVGKKKVIDGYRRLS